MHSFSMSRLTSPRIGDSPICASRRVDVVAFDFFSSAVHCPLRRHVSRCADRNLFITAVSDVAALGTPVTPSVKIVNHLYTPVYTLMAFRPSYLPSAGGPR